MAPLTVFRNQVLTMRVAILFSEGWLSEMPKDVLVGEVSTEM